MQWQTKLSTSLYSSRIWRQGWPAQCISIGSSYACPCWLSCSMPGTLLRVKGYCTSSHFSVDAEHILVIVYVLNYVIYSMLLLCTMLDLLDEKPMPSTTATKHRYRRFRCDDDIPLNSTKSEVRGSTDSNINWLPKPRLPINAHCICSCIPSHRILLWEQVWLGLGRFWDERWEGKQLVSSCVHKY